VHGPEIREEALRLVAAGVNDCEIARRLGVVRTTVRDWRRPRYIRELFVATCAEVGVQCRVSGKHVRINRRACVAKFVEHVGLKS